MGRGAGGQVGQLGQEASGQMGRGDRGDRGQAGGQAGRQAAGRAGSWAGELLDSGLPRLTRLQPPWGGILSLTLVSSRNKPVQPGDAGWARAG